MLTVADLPLFFRPGTAMLRVYAHARPYLNVHQRRGGRGRGDERLTTSTNGSTRMASPTYSDQPHPGAQKITAAVRPDLQSPARAGRDGRAPQPPRRGAALYDLRREPAHEPGNVPEHADGAGQRACGTGPAGGRSDLRVAGRHSGAVGCSGGQRIRADSVYRGAHSLAVKVEDSTGAVVCQSASVAFNVRQSSVLAPNSPLAAPPPVAPSTTGGADHAAAASPLASPPAARAHARRRGR